jgi:transcriptional regulator with XRE-family HTH domain
LQSGDVGTYKLERDRILKKFGLNLATLRLDLAKRRGDRISQEGFAREASVHRNEIGALERGEREPGLLMLLILADAAGVPVGQLTQGLSVPAERKPWPLAGRDGDGD